MAEPDPLEVSLGMELYSTDTPGLNGKLKQRYEDFVVEEIVPDGQVLNVEDWSETQPDRAISGDTDRHIHFTMQKMGLSTFDVASIIASSLRLPRNHIGYAGLKDKRAVTTQRISIPSRAKELLKIAKFSRIDIRDAHYKRHQVQIGDLWGNKFNISLSEIDSTSDQIDEIIGILKTTPIMNYFGVQRFGVARPQTHLVGKSLVRKEFEEAISVMLTMTSDFESESLQEARLQLSKSLEPTEELIETFPDDLRYEKEIMRQLIKFPGQYKRAFEKTPPRIQTLFIHSYQSYLFNRLLSQRAKQGLSITVPQPGDFIMQLDTTHSGRDSWLFVTDRNLEQRCKQVQDGEFALALPAPGYATKTPPSHQSDMLKELLSAEGIGLQDFRNKDQRNLDSPGGLHLAAIELPDISAQPVDNSVNVSIKLRKGSYATVVMREIMKNHPLNRI